MTNIALLLARLLLGLGIASHGAQKLFGWFGGYGLPGTGGFFESLGFRPGRLFAAAAGLAEFGSGLLIALGLGGPVGPALLILVMIVAIITVHAVNGFFGSNNGVEVPMIYAAGAFLLAFAGPGVYSLDALFGLTGLSTPLFAWIAVAVAVVGALINVAARQTAPDPVTSE